MVDIMFYSRSKRSGPVSRTYGRIGPILYDDYYNLPGIDMDELLGLYHSGQARDLIITRLEFHKIEIRGIVALLEDMGISTTTNWSVLLSEE